MLNKVKRRSVIGFFNLVIPTQIFAQSSKPDGCFRHPTSHAYFHSRILPPLCFKNAESWPLEKKYTTSQNTYSGPYNKEV